MAKKLGFIPSISISVIGALVSMAVTWQLKRLLQSRDLNERTDDLKASLRTAGASVSSLKEATAHWMSNKATQAASKTADVAALAKEQTHG